MKKVLEEEQLKIKGKEISKIVPGIVKDVSKLPEYVTSQEDELNILNDAKEFLEKEFNCLIEIVNSDESNESKAKSAVPGKAGILVE